ncbi:class I SAM-dependent methyltransferase [Bradyrhizobium sp. 521_C7_N1_3]|uniref:class I SAM-dependent methyltransferase n=1 Tax=Bradyrhizobium TaxID=374 RepID=UPI002714E152|nr:class I SAM-dependent methyltransferase [Bradyrhizobium japonicum]WLB57003.1 class I SAM-dependent methyltransferase [Bradyrhizobium japonicum]WLB61103.1 class I SAM-dependent methyltransferase [Bradyrhizobium japonicum]
MQKYRCVPSVYGHSAEPMPSIEEIERHYRESYYQDPTGQYAKTYEKVELDYFDDRANVALDFSALHGVAKGNVLDLGCGEGFVLKSARRRGFNVYGVDHSLVGIERQNRDLIDSNPSHFVAGDIGSRRHFEGVAFDLVYCKNVIEHVIDPDAIMARIASYLAPGGLAIIEVPNDFSELHSIIFGDTSKEELSIFVPPVHLHYFTTKALPELGRRNGFSVLDCFGDYPIDHLLMEDAFNYYKDKKLGSSAHSLRRKFFRYASGIDVEARLGLFRSIFTAGLGRDICIVVRR